MKNHLIVCGLAFVLASSSANAASVFVDQIGQNLLPLATSEMVSIDDVSTTAAKATTMMREVRDQYPLTGSSAALLVQTGDDHRAAINQTGPGNLGVVMQSGMMNSVNLMQSSSGNTAMIMQSGYRNVAAVSQMGNNHSAFVAQQGTGNVAVITQR